MAVNAGYYHSCALDSAGAIECWGDDEYGQVSGAP
jgi:alpha-tubulin suppressor-like RCC1 family protein